MSKNAQWFEKLQTVTPWGSGTCSKRARLTPEEPSVVVKGSGCRIWDADGKAYIDYRNGLGPITLGYCYKAVDDAVIEQLKSGISFSYPTPLEYEVAEMITKLRPHFGMAKFLKTGGEACSAAIRIARAYTEKSHIIQIGYNGWLNSLASSARVLPGQKLSGGVPGVPAGISQYYHTASFGDIDKISALFDEYAGDVAAVTVAVDYAGFYGGKEFYPTLRALCDKHKALIICDEIVAGFHYAMGGASEYFDFESDLSVYAKGFANGMPISAVAGRTDVMKVCDYGGKVVVSSTYAGESLSLAAAKTVVSIFKTENVIDHLWKMGELLISNINMLFDTYGIPLVYKGAWPVMSLSAKKEAPEGCADAFTRLAFKHGVSLYNCVYINYSHKEQDINETIERLESAMKELKA